MLCTHHVVLLCTQKERAQRQGKHLDPLFNTHQSSHPKGTWQQDRQLPEAGQSRHQLKGRKSQQPAMRCTRRLGRMQHTCVKFMHRSGQAASVLAVVHTRGPPDGGSSCVAAAASEHCCSYYTAHPEVASIGHQANKVHSSSSSQVNAHSSASSTVTWDRIFSPNRKVFSRLAIVSEMGWLSQSSPSSVEPPPAPPGLVVLGVALPLEGPWPGGFVAELGVCNGGAAAMVQAQQSTQQLMHCSEAPNCMGLCFCSEAPCCMGLCK